MHPRTSWKRRCSPSGSHATLSRSFPRLRCSEMQSPPPKRLARARFSGSHPGPHVRSLTRATRPSSEKKSVPLSRTSKPPPASRPATVTQGGLQREMQMPLAHQREVPSKGCPSLYGTSSCLAVATASSAPAMRETRCRLMSIPAAIPADVTTSPWSTPAHALAYQHVAVLCP